jgi:DNA-binding MarR family transcriptional regulator
VTTTSPPARRHRDRPPPATAGPEEVLDAVERALTDVARAMLRMPVPPEALGDGEHVDRSGYWALVRLDEAEGPVRVSDLAASLELDLSTVSRQVRHLVDSGLVARHSDPDDGRATLLALSDRGRLVLEAVKAARRKVLAGTLVQWSAEDRWALATAVGRLAADLHRGQAR